jgi:hypothetical protein
MCDAAALGGQVFHLLDLIRELQISLHMFTNVDGQVLHLLDLIREQRARENSPEDLMYLVAAQVLLDPLVPFDDPAATLAGENVSTAEQNQEKNEEITMKVSAFSGKEGIAEENNALPHAVPLSSPGEKAVSSELPEMKKGSKFCTSKLCFQPGLQGLREVPRRVLRSAGTGPAQGEISRADTVYKLQMAHCNACRRAWFVRRCPV